ncbi:hypothetical protein P691DRAFT_32948 [Macrolepiota fuliginosa MF-IS2]|uniref:Uncharacterized protein n=1 Tax=Macrolepiota fuliginosa MF-IS2 TaxID=1400762 RepID=A0A9P5X081_9AGAR|nr:hypothetical protein P691DRAFT_32948 [Macrolepiota fuliginosa MF-IS2]
MFTALVSFNFKKMAETSVGKFLVSEVDALFSHVSHDPNTSYQASSLFTCDRRYPKGTVARLYGHVRTWIGKYLRGSSRRCHLAQIGTHRIFWAMANMSVSVGTIHPFACSCLCRTPKNHLLKTQPQNDQPLNAQPLNKRLLL